MGLYITNTSLFSAGRSLNKATKAMNVSYQRLASGKRINSAKDDAAGLQIANRMTAQINGLTQGNRNANDGISLAQIADGAMDGMEDMVQRLRTLAVQAANGTYSTSEREAMQAESDELMKELERTVSTTKWGGHINILDGSHNNGKFTLQVGAYAGDTIDLDIDNVSYSALLGSATSAGLTFNTTATTVDGTNGSVSIMSEGDAQNAIGVYDSMIAYIGKARAKCGAVSNRLESTISNQENMIENISDARSRIMDTDYASEVAELTKNSILQQVAVAMMSRIQQAHANMILSLLGGV
jgi:flagellin